MNELNADDCGDDMSANCTVNARSLDGRIMRRDTTLSISCHFSDCKTLLQSSVVYTPVQQVSKPLRLL